jgi:asparagine synthase (glutamine-hydrolysing)
MCGIAGYCNIHQNYLSKKAYFEQLLRDMSTRLRHRGPDEQGIYLSDHVGFAHARLSILDLSTGQQPMTYTQDGKTYVICYNGEIYNMKELKNDLIQRGMKFQTTCDTEVLLLGYVYYGPDFVKKLNGIFAYAIADLNKNAYYLYLDAIGV